jgi:16S rRNA processing protein RimM
MGRNPQQEHAIQPEEVRLGGVNGVFGVSGEVRLFLHNRESDLFAGDGCVVTLVSPEGRREARRIRSRDGAGKRVLGLIDGVTTPEAARGYMDWEIVCAPDAFPDTVDDEYYHWQLVGMEVRTAGGEHVGQLTEVLEGDGFDCWQIKGLDGDVIVPAVKAVVASVSVADGVIILNELPDLGA